MVAHNKGKQYRLCKECGRKRYCSTVITSPDWRKTTCSQGHSWEWKIGKAAQIIAVELDRISSKLPSLFERDDLFYRAMKKR